MKEETDTRAHIESGGVAIDGPALHDHAQIGNTKRQAERENGGARQ
jgi:hypothetical protein